MAFFNFFNFPPRDNTPRDEEDDTSLQKGEEEVALSITALNDAHRTSILNWMEELHRHHRLSRFYTALARVNEVRRRKFLRNLAEAADWQRPLLMHGLRSPRFMQAYETVQGFGRGPALLISALILAPIAAISGGWGMMAFLLSIALPVAVLLGGIIVWKLVFAAAGGLVATFAVAAILTLIGALVVYLSYRNRTRDEREQREERREERRLERLRRQREVAGTASPTPEQPRHAQSEPVRVSTTPPSPTAPRPQQATVNLNGLFVVLLILAALAVVVWALNDIDVSERAERSSSPRRIVVAGGAQEMGSQSLGTLHLPVGVVRQDPGDSAVAWNTAACIGSTDGHGCSRENKWGALRRFAPGLRSCTTRTLVFVEPNGYVSKVFTAGSSGNAGCDRAQEYWMSRTVWDKPGWIGYDTTIVL